MAYQLPRTDTTDGRPDAHPAAPPTPQDPPPIRCCCGSAECAFLKHNVSVLDSVEKDVHTAAALGQALLVRHEAYMADAERDRKELTSRIQQLEMDNKELEDKNAKTIEENRDLLDQLESLNNTVSDSEIRIKSLEATLFSSQQTIRRLEGDTVRAESLERQLVFLEQEQADLHNTLVKTNEEARNATARWKRAERGISDLQDQLERIEREAREEKDRHAELMGRMQTQREVESQLDAATGRLKGATKSAHTGNMSNIMSHFVRDILGDNAHLQQGIMELREMLMNSNDEIQLLREQLMYHQPLGEGDASATSTLRGEGGPESSSQSPQSPSKAPPSTTITQEFHVHHHYHASLKHDAKRPKKKRQGLTPGVFIPPNQAQLSMSLPSTPPNPPWRPPALRQQGNPVSSNPRWSVLSENSSEFAPSTISSTPQSSNRNSLFDPDGVESLPTSPISSADPMSSPTWRPSHQKRFSNTSARSFQMPTNFSMAQNSTHPIIEESDDNAEVPGLTPGTVDESAGDEESISKIDGVEHVKPGIYGADTDDDSGPLRPLLHRTFSHESIISLSGGLDIHTLKTRPSQLTLRPISNATSVTASSTVTARPLLSRDSTKRSSMILRDNYAHSYAPSSIGSTRAVSGPAASSTSTSGSGFGKWAGWLPWGGGSSSAASTPQNNSIKSKEREVERSPGINQTGTIPGFREYHVAHSRKGSARVLPLDIDHEALQEGLTNDQHALHVDTQDQNGSAALVPT